MSLTELEALGRQVLAWAFVLGLALGWLIQRSHFCTMGAISDLVLMGNAMRLRQWALVVVVGMIGLAGMTLLGWLSPFNSIYASERFPWLSHVLGGGVFGIGMVLASGCPTKNLVRLGGGSLKALVVLVFMAAGALGALRGAPALLRTQWLDPVTTGVSSGPFLGQWLAASLGLSVPQGLFAAALLVGLPLLAWVLRDERMRRGLPLVASLGMGAIVLLSWWGSGVLGFVPEHPETLDRVFVSTASGRMEGLSFTAPIAQWFD
ncbi:MAG: YeeE/YedE family protein, partial [Betaproteobacteria bacterium]|nr:YeeE/YedE family protein [Betaproteobacteria bacterium]